ncbi:hypothetical protein NLU66_15160 [Brachybacterium sp. NBEC-018]|uniref:hypothetical protein n=1 Tax=Brachybacterium sp. NBEC-018 TaxID=2996004 RepID=UPI0021754781|nr:hypothetical protein [Brachybacterium sp. NBEC-018]UVY83539.1 hypothetical protein NLU66_15160 [Brachybacterium sp. NBEC-018]
MSQLQVTLEEAAARAVAGGVPPEHLHPVYRALLDRRGDPAPASPSPGTAPTGASAGAGSPGELALITAQLTARALLVLAVTDHEGTRRLRVALAPQRITLETSHGAGPALLEQAALEVLPERITALLTRAGIAPSVPRQEVGREEEALRLTDEQVASARESLARGVAPEVAFGSLDDLPVPLRDALTARGPRLAASLTLHDPRHRALAGPVSWSRLWVRGEHGLYRTDASDAPLGPVLPVGDGDVAGSLLAVIEEGVRFAAAATAGPTSGERR